MGVTGFSRKRKILKYFLQVFSTCLFLCEIYASPTDYRGNGAQYTDEVVQLVDIFPTVLDIVGGLEDVPLCDRSAATSKTADKCREGKKASANKIKIRVFFI